MSTSAQVRIVKPGTQVEDVMRDIIARKKLEDAFVVLDLSQLVYKYDEWRTSLPTVKPFYAIKCNDSLPIIKVLSTLGCGFDCASKEEIRKVLSQGVTPKNIIYANPAKPASHLQYAQKVGVSLMTFDNVIELKKIKKYFPEARIVLRIRADALDASIPLGTKFGCEPEQASVLMEEASKLDLNLVGISFHVGTGCKEPEAYPRAIKIALSLFSVAKKYGYQLSLLDIGGGYPGDAPAEFYKVSRLINNTLEEKKEQLNGISLIAEPGRYFVCTAYKLAANVVGIRESPSKTIYTINESVFGLFNCIYTEHIFKIPVQLNKCRQGMLKSSAIWGQTQSPYDRLVDDCLLPQLNVGEWLVFDDMGAYTVCLCSNFQSYTKPETYYVVGEDAWKRISKEWKAT